MELNQIKTIKLDIEQASNKNIQMELGEKVKIKNSMNCFIGNHTKNQKVSFY